MLANLPSSCCRVYFAAQICIVFDMKISTGVDILCGVHACARTRAWCLALLLRLEYPALPSGHVSIYFLLVFLGPKSLGFLPFGHGHLSWTLRLATFVRRIPVGGAVPPPLGACRATFKRTCSCIP